MIKRVHTSPASIVSGAFFRRGQRRQSQNSKYGRLGRRTIHLVAVIVAIYATGLLLQHLQSEVPPVRSNTAFNRTEITFVSCGGQPKPFCVVDGDTIRFEGVKIRIADIDTPEIFSPKCAAEAQLGHRASARMQELLNEGPVTLVQSGSRDEDRYGRKLRVVVRNGHSLGDILVAEGLARTWDGARRSWCG